MISDMLFGLGIWVTAFTAVCAALARGGQASNQSGAGATSGVG
jgi:hypothetical protein